VGLLDGTAPYLEVLAYRVLVLRCLKTSESNFAVQEHAVPAVEEVHQVGRCVYEVAVDPLHDLKLLSNERCCV
jgi:hypothetical protein